MRRKRIIKIFLVMLSIALLIQADLHRGQIREYGAEKGAYFSVWVTPSSWAARPESIFETAQRSGRSFTVSEGAILANSLGEEDRSKAGKIEELMDQYHQLDGFSGAVLVVHKGKEIFRKAYGLANIGHDVPNNPDTKFNIGSISKQFTATLVLQLIEEKKLAFEDPITKHLTDYPREKGDKITLHHLLSHTSGIEDFLGHPDYEKKMKHKYKLSDLIQEIAEPDLEFEPGKNVRYSNSNYYILAAIIEKVLGISYDSALQSRIFKPLGMSNSGFMDRGVIAKNMAAGYMKNCVGCFENAPFDEPSVNIGAGNIYSTVGDLYKWDRSLYTDAILSQSSRQLMMTPQGGVFGYGWMIQKDKDRRKVHHGGMTWGFIGKIIRYVDDDNAIIWLANHLDRMSFPWEKQIESILYDEPYVLSDTLSPETKRSLTSLRSFFDHVVEQLKAVRDRMDQSTPLFVRKQVNQLLEDRIFALYRSLLPSAQLSEGSQYQLSESSAKQFFKEGKYILDWLRKSLSNTNTAAHITLQEAASPERKDLGAILKLSHDYDSAILDIQKEKYGSQAASPKRMILVAKDENIEWLSKVFDTEMSIDMIPLKNSDADREALKRSITTDIPQNKVRIIVLTISKTKPAHLFDLIKEAKAMDVNMPINGLVGNENEFISFKTLQNQGMMDRLVPSMVETSDYQTFRNLLTSPYVGRSLGAESDVARSDAYIDVRSNYPIIQILAALRVSASVWIDYMNYADEFSPRQKDEVFKAAFQHKHQIRIYFYNVPPSVLGSAKFDQLRNVHFLQGTLQSNLKRYVGRKTESSIHLSRGKLDPRNEVSDEFKEKVEFYKYSGDKSGTLIAAILQVEAGALPGLIKRAGYWELAGEILTALVERYESSLILIRSA